MATSAVVVHRLVNGIFRRPLLLAPRNGARSDA